MRYGFIIDNRKCIGCHACTTACKAEHEVPVGVNRTWVKQVEKGTFPNTRRIFSVLRCNHCADAPCVEICPVEALFIRDDGIVDFDKRRCIGCKSCMQACPYDALYIDPDTHTAAKCNYCAHRVDLGLEPACVNVCPEHAIISGNIEDPDSEIAQLLVREQVTVRKPEKGTVPYVFYINGDEASLNPDATTKDDEYLWSSQTRGVGHYARAAEKFAWSNDDIVEALTSQEHSDPSEMPIKPAKSVEVLMGGTTKSRRVYDAPDKGILWGWEVPAYVLTKAIASGVFLLYFLAFVFGSSDAVSALWSLGISIAFLMLTGAFLVKDLDKPERFLYVLLRPQWRSWLTRGGYAITVFGGLMSLQMLSVFFGWDNIARISSWVNVPVALLVSVYTAFLFGQAKGRDFWQNPLLVVHMVLHSMMAGGATLLAMQYAGLSTLAFVPGLEDLLVYSILVHLVILLIEFSSGHETVDAQKTADMIIRGRYARLFWGVVIFAGSILPIVLLTLSAIPLSEVLAAIAILAGVYFTEKIWVEAPQRISLS